MTDSEYAQRQSEALRFLIERAPIYRAISGLTALTAGLLSLGGFATAYYAKHHRHHPLTSGEFRIVWLVILALTLLANFVFLWRDASRSRCSLFSPAMGYALQNLAPTFAVAAMLTSVLHHPIQLALAWIPLYGMALLAAQSFAPRSLIVLGSAFLVTGCGLLATWRHFFMPLDRSEPSALVVSGILAATFGGFHLTYAACVWASSEGKIEDGTPKA